MTADNIGLRIGIVHKHNHFNKPSGIAESASALGVLSLAGPATGFIAEMALAWRYGSGAVMDGYRSAFLLIVFGSQLFTGYVLPNVLVPVLSDMTSKGRKREEWAILAGIMIMLLAAFIPLLIWIWVAPFTIVNIIAPGYIGASASETALHLKYFVIVFLLGIISGTLCAYLMAMKIFWVAPVGQMISNLLLLLFVYLIGDKAGGRAIDWGITMGAMTFLGLSYYAVRTSANKRLPIFAGFPGRTSWRTIIVILHKSLPLFAIIICAQYSSYVINRELSLIETGAVAIFGYAFKIMTVATLIPAVLSTVVFPSLADYHSSNRATEYSRLIWRSIRMMLMLSVPVVAISIAITKPIFGLAFGRGAMHNDAIMAGAGILEILLMSAPAGLMLGLLSKAVYAAGDTISPFVITLLGAILSGLMIPIISKYGGVIGVAGAFTVIAWLCAGILFLYVGRRYDIVSVKIFVRYILRLVGLSVIAWLVVKGANALFYLALSQTPNSIMLAGDCILMALIGGLVVWKTSILVGLSEGNELASYCRRCLVAVTGMITRD